MKLFIGLSVVLLSFAMGGKPAQANPTQLIVKSFQCALNLVPRGLTEDMETQTAVEPGNPNDSEEDSPGVGAPGVRGGGDGGDAPGVASPGIRSGRAAFGRPQTLRRSPKSRHSIYYTPVSSYGNGFAYAHPFAAGAGVYATQNSEKTEPTAPASSEGANPFAVTVNPLNYLDLSSGSQSVPVAWKTHAAEVAEPSAEVTNPENVLTDTKGFPAGSSPGGANAMVMKPGI